MIGDLFTKLNEAREKIEASKKELTHIIIEKSSPDGKITIKANANKFITDIKISDELLGKLSKQELEESLIDTVNDALEEAARRGEIEMKKITKGMIPNFPGLV